MNLINLLVHRKRLILTTAILLAVAGLYSWFDMKRQEDPFFPYRNGFVLVQYPGADVEHIENLDFIFKEAFAKLKSNGLFFICELHPFKQYNGTKARFETETGLTELEVYTHNISEFTSTAFKNGFKILELKEWFDDFNEKEIPRLVSFVFQK